MKQQRIPFVDLKSQYLNIKSDIDDAISSVIDQTAFIKGEFVKSFEHEFSNHYGIKNTISCANGTDAIYIALKTLGIGPGDEVITVANTWISTAETITQCGAKPVFIDIEENFFTIDSELIEQKINNQTKAIIPVHLYGHPVNMDRIKEICDKHNLHLIEDCAQAHFAEWKGQRVGTFGVAGTFSFFPGKNLGAYGDAGAIISNSVEFSEKARMYANHGSLIKHEHEIEGINSRLDGIQASILSVKLRNIDEWTKLRISNSLLYNKYLSNLSNIRIPKVDKSAKHVFHLYVLLCEKRDELMNYLKLNGISTGLHYPKPLPFVKAYNYLSHTESDFPISNKYSERILSLPMYPELTNNQIKYICEHIHKFYEKIL